MDGAWALYEAWVKIQLGEVDTALVYGYGKSVARRPAARGADPPARPVLTSPRCGPTRRRLAALQARAAARRRHGHRGGHRPRWPRAAAANAHGQPVRPAGVEPLRARAARRGADRRPAAQARLPADHRRRRRGDPGRRRRGPRAVRRARRGSEGIDHRIEPHGPRPARPHRCRPRPRTAGEKAGVADGIVRRGRAARTRSAHQELILREALGLGDDVDVNPSGGPLARQPGDGGRPHPHRRGRPPDHSTATRDRAWPTPPRARACSRTSSASWKGT